ncbi:MAG: hypothetical protein K9H26_19655 [Prolixibacteraceae bacterium]|nr:hypothetical protein [Prolixibacteraceae bacterium]
MKKSKLLISLLIIMILTLQLSFNNKSVSGFKVASGWGGEWGDTTSAPGQIPQSYWEETAECTLWSHSGSGPFNFPVCLQWTTTITERIKCIDNYVCPECTCQPV